jgi:hypothetical protein
MHQRMNNSSVLPTPLKYKAEISEVKKLYEVFIFPNRIKFIKEIMS